MLKIVNNHDYTCIRLILPYFNLLIEDGNLQEGVNNRDTGKPLDQKTVTLENSDSGKQ